MALGGRRLLPEYLRVVYDHNLVLAHLILILLTAVIAELMVPGVVIAKPAIITIDKVLFGVIEILLIVCFLKDSILHALVFTRGAGCIV